MKTAPNLMMLYGSLLLALLCQLFPWTGQSIILRPDFMLVVLLYWLFRAPYLCNVGTAWAMGVLVDLATGSLLGQHALAFSLTAYFAMSFQRRLVLFSQLQIMAFTFVLLAFTRFSILILKLLSGNEAPTWHYFLPVLTSILLWQVMKLVFGPIAHPKSNEAN